MKIVRKKITEEEFLKLKEMKPFSVLRQDSKGINFGLIFGMSYIKFSSANLEPKWSEERIDSFIQEKDLHDIVLQMKERHQDQGIDPKLYKYYAVAFYIRTQFFETYPGLMARMKRNEAFAKEHGYIRSFHGAIRRVPLMSLAFGEDGKPRKHENRRELANMINIVANSTIQSDESITINWAIVDWNDPRAQIVGTVHDSCDFYVEREYAVEILQKLKKHFERLYPEWQGDLVWPIDLTVVDLTKPGQYYKKGVKATTYIKEHS